MKKIGILAAALLLATAVTAVSIGAAADASGGNAVAAKKKKKKKKCPAGTHKVVKVKIKNGKKRKKIKCVPNAPTTTTTTTTGGSPLVRATLTWSGGGDSTDYDLYIFDANGVLGRASSNPLPNTSFSPAGPGTSGTETFTDLIFSVPGRTFKFGVCHSAGGSDGTSYSIDYVTSDGVHHTDTHSGGSSGFNGVYTGSPGDPVTNTFTCPAP
jgi:hypothetical protein